MFNVFRENNLSPITSSATETEVKKWKQTMAVKKSYNNLFKKIRPHFLKRTCQESLGNFRKIKRTPQRTK